MACVGNFERKSMNARIPDSSSISDVTLEVNRSNKEEDQCSHYLSGSCPTGGFLGYKDRRWKQWHKVPVLCTHSLPHTARLEFRDTVSDWQATREGRQLNVHLKRVRQPNNSDLLHPLSWLYLREESEDNKLEKRIEDERSKLIEKTKDETNLLPKSIEKRLMDSNPQSDNDMCLSEQQMKEIYYEARNMKDNHMGQFHLYLSKKLLFDWMKARRSLTAKNKEDEAAENRNNSGEKEMTSLLKSLLEMSGFNSEETGSPNVRVQEGCELQFKIGKSSCSARPNILATEKEDTPLCSGIVSLENKLTNQELTNVPFFSSVTPSNDHIFGQAVGTLLAQLCKPGDFRPQLQTMDSEHVQTFTVVLRGSRLYLLRGDFRDDLLQTLRGSPEEHSDTPSFPLPKSNIYIFPPIDVFTGKGLLHALRCLRALRHLHVMQNANMIILK